MKRLILIGMVLALLIGLVFAGKYYATRLVDAKVRDVVAKVAKKTKSEINYKSLDIDVMDRELAVNDVKLSLLKGRKFDVDRIVVQDLDIRHPRKPLYAKVAVQGITIPVNETNFGSHYAELNDLGYKTIKADIKLDYRLDKAKQLIQLNWFEVDIPTLGHFRVRVNIEGVDLEAVQAAVAKRQIGGVFDNLVVENMYLAYDDKSLLRKIVEIAAVEEKESIQFLVSGLRSDIETARANGNENAIRTMEEVIEFLQSPGALAIEVERKEPLPLGNLDLYKKISNFMKQFTIKVTAGPAEEPSHG